MEELYALYLRLYALRHAGSSGDFGTALNDVLQGATVVRSVEINAVAAMAVMALLDDFYEFQQRWERYRNLAPRP